MKYVIISNRLPVTVVGKGAKLTIARSGGGLATGLASLDTGADTHWVGWPGCHIDDGEPRYGIDRRLNRQRMHPVHLSPEHIQDYYEGYSNSILWPMCHYFLTYMVYDSRYWKAYREVNEIFCEEALKVIRPGDTVWIHDYHLMLLPALIRKHMPSVSIGYFHHIPFPSYELFRCLPERADILRGLLGADLIGFHVHGYMRYFISALYRVLSLQCHMDKVHFDDRVVGIEAFPMGINYQCYNDAITKPEVRAYANRLKKIVGNRKIILSVDRLDYSKGIPIRLRSYADFLDNTPDFRGKITLLLVVVPSRDSVDSYAGLKKEIDTLVGHINGKYAKPSWTPVLYFYRSFPFSRLSAIYNMANVALVTPLRDGMNLVAKEFVAAKRDRPGVLILSEMAGAVVELSGALIVNPMDAKQIGDAIFEALTMPEEEQLSRLQEMQQIVSRQSVTRWARDFLKELAFMRQRNDELTSKPLADSNMLLVRKAYAVAQKRLLVLDYDGTLAPFVNVPSRAYPTERILGILDRLASDKRNKVVVCSGRDKDTLERWLGHLPIGLTAEHGALYRENGAWCENCPSVAWDAEILSVFEQITDKTPRSRIEIKRTAMVWHFREVDTWLADLRINQLINALITPATRLGLQIMRGNKILELKLPEYNKGVEVKRLLAMDEYNFVLAVGDDTTDEDMFAVLPEYGISIKVGAFSDIADYSLSSQEAVPLFLESLSGSTST